MTDAEWDADGFEPNMEPKGTVLPKGLPLATDKWEGEDEDQNIRDNWDDDEEEKSDAVGAASTTTTVQVPKKKRPLKERLAEIEERKRKEAEEKRKQEDEYRKAETPAEKFAEKMRQQKIQEEADLNLAIEAFGLGSDDKGQTGVIDAFEPSSKEDFIKFADILVAKINKYEKSPLYDSFIQSFYQKLALGLEADAMKRVSISLAALSNEKAKLKQATSKGKKKNQKASLAVSKDSMEMIKADGGDAYDDFDDYV